MKDALDTSTGELPLSGLAQLADRLEALVIDEPMTRPRCITESIQALRDGVADRALLHAIKTAMKGGDTLGSLQIKLDAALALLQDAQVNTMTKEWHRQVQELLNGETV